MRLDWQAAFPGALNQPLRDSLATHLDALLNQPLPHVALDGALVDEARLTFSRVSLAERVYQVIRRSPDATSLPPWIPADAAGVTGANLFTRRSGAKMTDGLPGFYTVDGFYKVVLPDLPRALTEVANDSWVLGKQSEFNVASPQAATLQQDVVKLYTDEYAANWDGFLADLDLPPLTNSQQSMQNAVCSVIASIADARHAERDREAIEVGAPAAGRDDPGRSRRRGCQRGDRGGQRSGLPPARFIGNPAAPSEPPGKAIEDRYEALIKFVGSGPGAPIELGPEIAQRSAAATGTPQQSDAGRGRRPGGASVAIAQLRAEAARAPQPVSAG